MKNFCYRALVALLLSMASFSLWASIDLCFIAGYTGGGPVLEQTMVQTATSQGVTLKVFVPSDGINLHDPSIQDYALNVKNQLNQYRQLNPNNSCLFIAHSMGALLLRYIINHHDLINPATGLPEASNLFIGRTMVFTLGAPHHGLPGFVPQLGLPPTTAWAQMTNPNQMDEFNNPSSPHYSPLVGSNVFFWSIITYLTSPLQAANFLEAFYFNNILFQFNEFSDGLIPVTSQSIIGEGATSFLNVSHSWANSDPSAVFLYLTIYQFISPFYPHL